MIVVSFQLSVVSCQFSVFSYSIIQLFNYSVIQLFNIMRSIPLLFLLLGFSFLTKAQIVETTPYEFAYGVSGGATFSSVSFSPRVLQHNLKGMTFGITGRMTMGEHVGLQVELNYTQQGWNEKFEPEDVNEENEEASAVTNYKYNRTMNYFQLPFYTHVQFGSDNVKGFINAGPQIGYLISESTRENLNGAQPGRVNIQHEMAAQKKFEWGISGGAGIEVRTGIGYFTLEGRYLYSLGDIYNTRQEDPFSKASGQTITVKLSYLIPVK